MLSEQAKGVYVISATPFTEAGDIDYASVDTLVDFYLARRVHGITILGMMGEANKLTFEETARFTRHVLRRSAGRAEVVVGITSQALAVLRAIADIAMDEGAAGVLVAPIAGLRTDEQIHTYFADVCRTLGPQIPFALQDYPQSTGVFISAPQFGRMVRSFPQLVMLKHEDSPGLGKLSRIRADAAREGDRRVSILVGNGGLYFPQELRRGADGAMTGFAYPEMLVAVYERFVAGDPEGAEDLFDAYLPLVRHEQQPGFGLAVRKELLRRRGAIATAKVRSPCLELTGADLRELDVLQRRLERALARLKL